MQLTITKQDEFLSTLIDQEGTLKQIERIGLEDSLPTNRGVYRLERIGVTCIVYAANQHTIHWDFSMSYHEVNKVMRKLFRTIGYGRPVGVVALELCKYRFVFNLDEWLRYQLLTSQ